MADPESIAGRLSRAQSKELLVPRVALDHRQAREQRLGQTVIVDDVQVGTGREAREADRSFGRDGVAAAPPRPDPDDLGAGRLGSSLPFHHPAIQK